METYISPLRRIVSLRDELMNSTSGELIRKCSKGGMYILMRNIMRSLGDSLEIK